MDKLSLKNFQINFKGNNSAYTCIAAYPALLKKHFQKIFKQNKLTLRFAMSYISNFKQVKNFILNLKDKFFFKTPGKDRNMMKIKTLTLCCQKKHPIFNDLKHKNKNSNKPIKYLMDFN